MLLKRKTKDKNPTLVKQNRQFREKWFTSGFHPFLTFCRLYNESIYRENSQPVNQYWKLSLCAALLCVVAHGTTHLRILSSFGQSQIILVKYPAKTPQTSVRQIITLYFDNRRVSKHLV